MNHVLNTFLNAAIVVVILLFIFVFLPVIETRWFPVYSPFEVINIEPSKKGSKVTFRYTKYRDCFPQGYSWYTNDLGRGLRQLGVTPRLTAPQTPVGRNQTTMEIEITPEEFAGPLYAEIYSRCHPFWVTRSIVFQ
jgi:hypothetical protein